MMSPPIYNDEKIKQVSSPIVLHNIDPMTKELVDQIIENAVEDQIRDDIERRVRERVQVKVHELQ